MSTKVVSVFDLTPSEKLQLVEDLWDDLASKPSDVPVREWQRAELDRRRANLAAQPATSALWSDLKQKVRRRHGR